MGAHEKIKIEVLKETVIQGYNDDTETVITQSKESYMDNILYKIFLITKYDGKLFDIATSCATDNRKISDSYFFSLEKKYQGSSITRKIF